MTVPLRSPLPPLEQALQNAIGPGLTLERELLGGGMSRVFVARDHSLKRDVAVKVLPPDLLSEGSAARFYQEIELTATLQHPHILPVISAGGNERLLFYVTPYIRGESFRDRMRAGWRPGVHDAMRLVDELLSAVVFAHKRGVIHRDIKPGNVLLAEEHAILADFGIARALERPDDTIAGQSGETGSTVAGTPAYVAPERPRDERADLYAAAALTHELLTGQQHERPPEHGTIAQRILAVHPSISGPEAARVASVLARALATDPAARYSTAGELRGALRDASGASASAPRVSSSRMAIAAAVTLVATASLVAWQGLRPTPRPLAAAPGSLAANTGAFGVTQAGRARPAADSGAVERDSAPASVDGSPRVAAVTATYDSAVAVLKSGDITTAKALLLRAARDQPSAVHPHVGLAVLNGLFEPSPKGEEMRGAATHALAGRDSLDAHDAALMEGIEALGAGANPDACSAFERARRARPSFEAHLGIAECQLRDSLVVTGSDGEPRFRSSFNSAADALAEALRRRTLPVHHGAYRRLRAAFFTVPGVVRRGLDSAGAVYVAHPELAGDTVRFVPRMQGRPSPPTTPDVMASRARAYDQQRGRVLPIVEAYAKTAPREYRVDAHVMLAETLEAMGFIRDRAFDGVSALDAVRRARAASLPAQRGALQRFEMRLRLRARDFAAAGALGDSILAVQRADSDADVSLLLGPAALTGRVRLVTAYAESQSGQFTRRLSPPNGRPVVLPPAFIRERSRFAVAAAFGVCTDAVRSAPRRLLEMLDAFYGDAERPPGVEGAALDAPLAQAVTCVGADEVQRIAGGNPQAFRATNRALAMLTPSPERVQREVDGIVRGQGLGQANVAPDQALLEAQLRLAVGDTAGARRALRRFTDVLSVTSPAFAADYTQAATAVRVFALTAELADATGDRKAAGEWSRAVAALWRNADPALQPVVARMRAIASRAGSDD